MGAAVDQVDPDQSAQVAALYSTDTDRTCTTLLRKLRISHIFAVAHELDAQCYSRFLLAKYRRGVNVYQFIAILRDIFYCHATVERRGIDFPWHDMAATALLRAAFNLYWKRCWEARVNFRQFNIATELQAACYVRIVMDADIPTLLLLPYSDRNAAPALFALVVPWQEHPAPLAALQTAAHTHPHSMRFNPYAIWQLLLAHLGSTDAPEKKLYNFPAGICRFQLHLISTFPAYVDLLKLSYLFDWF